MARDKAANEVVDAIKKEPTFDDRISRFVGNQGAEFPDASTISMEFKYQNPFEVPGFLDQKNYAYAWLDPNDDIQMYNAMENGFYKIVTRSSSCILDSQRADSYFKAHGAIELQRMILAFRPVDIENRMRQQPVERHKSMIEAVSEPKEKEGYSTSHSKFTGDHNRPEGALSSIEAFEEAGEEGIQFAK